MAWIVCVRPVMNPTTKFVHNLCTICLCGQTYCLQNEIVKRKYKDIVEHHQSSIPLPIGLKPLLLAYFISSIISLTLVCIPLVFAKTLVHHSLG